jgi:hypothetical protein
MIRGISAARAEKTLIVPVHRKKAGSREQIGVNCARAQEKKRVQGNK